jgi:hypothetical protein
MKVAQGVAFALWLPCAAVAQPLQRQFVVPLEPETVWTGPIVVATAIAGDGIAIGTLSQKILVFDSAGRVMRRLGGEGGGPGEFRRLVSLSSLGDTLYALDGVGRLSVFSPGDSVLTRRIVRPDNGGSVFEPVALSETRIVYMQHLRDGDPAAFSRGSRVLIADADGHVTDSLRPLDLGKPRMQLDVGNSGVAVLPQPFVERDHLAIDGRSGGVAVVRPPQTRFNLFPSRVTIEFAGDSAERFRYAGRTDELRNETVQRWLDERSQQMASRFQGGARSARRALERALERPILHPVVGAALLGVDGTVWVLQSPSDALRPTWLVFSDRGVSLGTVEVSRGTRLLVVSATVVWALEENSDGEQQLVRFTRRTP